MRTNQKIIIDGDISDSAWKTAAVATDLIEYRPNFGKHESYADRTEIYILYDDEAIYVGGFCHEAAVDSISKELVGRDVVGVNDFVGVLFDTYNDKINGFGYYVTPLGEQFDAKYSNTGEDASWNSVYESQAKIVKGGWTFEMKIPYSAIRFGKSDVQNWGFEITRKRNKAGKQFFWNPIDPNIGGTLFAQAGLLKNITDIKPPLRLSLSPYFSAYANHYPYNTPDEKNWTTSINGGMDVKYGLNQSFTLDMTLLPDFGQVQSDNQVLNLTPFEVKYNEYRTFFTEGAELFNKGNFFYSRRIGGTPLHYYDVYNDVNTNEIVSVNPVDTKLINATKISGRTADGWGVGVLNAVTAAQFATILNTATGATREVQTNPLTNYNIVVFDKSLKNNSSLSFINLSTWRSGTDYDADVSSFLWDFYDKKNVWNLAGKYAESQLYGYGLNGKAVYGHTDSISVIKQGGRLNFEIAQMAADSNYQQNDLGYQTTNNYIYNDFWIGYKWIKPKSFYNNLYLNFNTNYSLRYNQKDYQSLYFNTNLNGQLKNLWQFLILVLADADANDFYEPRVPGRVYKRPYDYGENAAITTNQAKNYYLSFELDYVRVPKIKENNFNFMITNQYRFNKNLTISLTDNINPITNGVGFAADSTNINTGNIDVYFGKRNVITIENIFNIKYNFSNTMGLSFRARHYWSNVTYKQFYLLNNDGTLSPTTAIFPNDNVNFFNIDMLYTWQFALGSFLNIGWKNAISTDDQYIEYSYFKNAQNVLIAPQNNNFSVQVIYYLDFLKFRKHKV